MVSTNLVLRILTLDSWVSFGLLSQHLSTYFIFTVNLVVTSSHSFKYSVPTICQVFTAAPKSLPSWSLHSGGGAEYNKVRNYIDDQKMVKY